MCLNNTILMHNFYIREHLGVTVENLYIVGTAHQLYAGNFLVEAGFPSNYM